MIYYNTAKAIKTNDMNETKYVNHILNETGF